MVARDYSRLTKLRRAAAWVLWAEALTLTLAPCLGLLLAYVAVGLLGFGNQWLLVAMLGAAAWLLGWRLWHFSAPTGADIERRIEAASGLLHQPFATLRDTPENNAVGASIFWAAHQRRAAVVLGSARLPQFDVQAAARDKFALRGLLLAWLLVGIVVAGAQAPLRMAAAFTLPEWPFPGPRVTAWVTPPSYTGLPAHVLASGAAFTTLVGAHLTVITDGPRQAPRVKFGKGAVATRTLSDTSHRADATISGSALLTVGPWWHRLARWNITAVPPVAPVVVITRAEIVRANSISLQWHVIDPYGLATLAVLFKPVGYSKALNFSFALPAHTGNGQALVTLARSPFAGELVTLRVAAENLAGVSGSASAVQNFILPGLHVHDATATALLGLRRQLANAGAMTGFDGVRLQQLSRYPPSAISPAADVQMAVLGSSIALGAPTAADAVARLLALALEIEAGPDFLPAQQLAASNQALLAALQAGLHGAPPNAAALQKLLQAMEAAAARHIAALQAAAGQAAAGQEGKSLQLSALDELAQKIAQDEAAGRTAQAVQELQRLQNILHALQNAKPVSAAQMALSQAAQAAALAAAQAIAKVTKAQAGLLDATNAGRGSAAAQGAIKDQLDAARQNLTKAGLDLPGLAPAGAAMQNAKTALAGNNPGRAATAETTAIKNLQDAAAALAKAQKQQISLNPGEAAGQDDNGDSGDGLPDEQPDPHFNLGHANTAAAIQQRIIQQDGKPAPVATHQYYQKLLATPP